MYPVPEDSDAFAGEVAFEDIGLRCKGGEDALDVVPKAFEALPCSKHQLQVQKSQVN